MANGFQATKVATKIANTDYILETGKMANQAHGSVWVQSGDTVVLVTAVTQPLERDIDFMPLVVDYQEMSYASGRIPGSYFRREIGRPSERETLVSRLIDRPIRPLFPDGFSDEVQIIATVLSADPNNDPDVLAITGASAALHISKIPFSGPIAGGRVAYVESKFILNPSLDELEYSELNLVLAASKEAVVMVEGSAKFASEELVAKAIAWGHEQLQPLLKLQEELRDKAGQPKMAVTPPIQDQEIKDFVQEHYSTKLSQVLKIAGKIERKENKAQLKEQLVQDMEQHFPERPEAKKLAFNYLKELEKTLVRQKIKNEQIRIDGRKLDQVREISIDIGLLPRSHGSALFARGETKALGVATLGGSRDEQHVETLSGEQSKRFMLHYNFPPYCVGEVKMLRGPARREIGHGALAERSLLPVLPSEEEFPFTIRIVSEVMESNGSSSMATVCAGSLALMDAGVPITAPVAGIAMGLIKEGDSFFILTDILGDEDHLGDMDFKTAGTAQGITGIQMDIKIAGIPIEIINQALERAKAARTVILEKMNTIIAEPRSKLSKHAPKLEKIKVDPARIKDVIGPGGKNIKAITKASGASIDIDDSGEIAIFAPDSDALKTAVEMILFYDQKPELGKDYLGTIKTIKDFGVFVEILPGVEGMVHVSQFDINRINNLQEHCQIGDEIKVKVIEIDPVNGKIKLSRKAVLMEEQGKTFKYPEPRQGGRRDNRFRPNSHSNGPRRHSNGPQRSKHKN